MAKLLKWIVNLILLCSIVVAGALLIPPLAGVTTVMVDEVDMDTNLEKGAVAYAKEIALSELEVGDQVLINENGSYVYRVKSIDVSDGTCKLEDTRTPNSTGETKTFKHEVAKVVLIVPFIGYIPMAMKSTEGLIVIGLAVVFVVILFILAELWRPDDEEDEEEDEEETDHQPVPERTPIPVDVSSIIMEEASNEIASAVSSVVAEEQMENEKTLQEEVSTEEEQSAERMILGYDDMYDDASDETSDETTDEAEEAEEKEEAVEVSESQESMDETETEIGEEMETERELAMPLYTAQELIMKAKEKGEEPEIILDENTGVTILDYSNLL